MGASRHGIFGTLVPFAVGLALELVGVAIAFAETAANSADSDPVVVIVATALAAAGGWLHDRLRKGKVDQEIAGMEIAGGARVAASGTDEFDLPPEDPTDAGDDGKE
jgi:hypothetical protein